MSTSCSTCPPKAGPAPVRSVQQFVKDRRAGESPKRRGPNPAYLSDESLNLLLRALESHVRVNQANCNAGLNERKMLMSKINLTLRPFTNTKTPNVLNSLFGRTKLSLTTICSDPAEERRVWWTTAKNITDWFDKWEKEMLELGFAQRDDTGHFYFNSYNLQRILNIDETALSLDGSQSKRGGRPLALVGDRNLKSTGIQAMKSSCSITFIGGSTAVGEPLPPHFQFPTKAKDPERHQIRCDFFAFAPKIIASYGCYRRDGTPLPKEWPVTIGMNSCGGMDEVEFQKYVEGSIMPLFPDAEDQPGKRVLIKVDGGPGRYNNTHLLAKLKL